MVSHLLSATSHTYTVASYTRHFSTHQPYTSFLCTLFIHSSYTTYLYTLPVHPSYIPNIHTHPIHRTYNCLHLSYIHAKPVCFEHHTNTPNLYPLYTLSNSLKPYKYTRPKPSTHPS